MRRLVGRAALVVLGIALGLAVLESILQLGALAMRLTGQTVPGSWLTGNRRILFLGDSNTYGLYLKDRRDAFPHRFEALWNAVPELPRVEVINFGYPGTNSSRVRRELDGMLRELRPDMVVLMIGTNDSWTIRLPDAEPRGAWERAASFIELRSRVYLLWHMIRRSLARAEVEFEKAPVHDAKGRFSGERAILRYGDAEFAMGFRKGLMGAHGPYLTRQLGDIAAIAKSYDTYLVLMTYASEEASYADANERIRQAAELDEIPLVDVVPAMRQVCPREPCREFFYPDHHPTARGHAVVAEALMQRLLYLGPLADGARAR